MATLTLVPGNTYSLKPTKIEGPDKLFPTANGPRYRFWVEFVDKNGNTVKAEYPSPYDPQMGFELNVFQYVTCKYITKNIPEVVPGDEPARPAQPIYNDIKEAAKTTEYIDTRNVPIINPYNKNVSGTSSIFAMAYAKDILCAEIARQPKGYKTTDEDMDRMIKNFHTIVISQTSKMDLV